MVYREGKRMEATPPEETQDDQYGWTHRKAASALPSSDSSMDDDRKELIRKALEFDIIDIRTYVGYQGDMLVEITSLDRGVIESLKKSAEELGFETVIKKDVIDIQKLFCITPATDIYDLK